MRQQHSIIAWFSPDLWGLTSVLLPNLSTERSKSCRWKKKKITHATGRYSDIWQTSYTTKSKLQFLSLEHTKHPRPLQMNYDSLLDVGRQSGNNIVCLCSHLCCLFDVFECFWHLYAVFSFALWCCMSLSALSGLSGARMKLERHPGNAQRWGWQDSLQSVERCWNTLTFHI